VPDNPLGAEPSASGSPARAQTAESTYKEHTMHGPALTPQEAVASLARRVRRLEAAGLDRDQAIRRAAAETGIEPEKVRWCAERAPGGVSTRPIESGHGGDQPHPQSEHRRQHSIHAHEKHTVRTAPGSRRRRPRAALALAAAALVAGLLALAPAASAAGKTFNVNPATGNDTNTGTATKPLKTLTKALSKAHAGDTVKLAAGLYGPGASGDQYPQSGLPVPAGVTIEGATDSGFPVATLLGPGAGAALNLAGDATVRNLIWGGQGFGIGLFAKQGTQTLSNLLIAMPPGASANVDGLTLNGGIVLRGTAHATLNAGAAGANTTGSSFFLNGGTAVNALEQARFTMNGGRITGGDQPNCRTDAKGIVLRGAAQATLKDILAFRNLAGAALSMASTAKATLGDSLIVRDLPAGCDPSPSVVLGDSASLTMERANLLQNGAPDRGIGILTTCDAACDRAPSASLTHRGSAISGYAKAIQAKGEGNLTLQQANLGSCHVCIDAQSASGSIAITDSNLSTGRSDIGVGIIAPTLKLRDSVVENSHTGILITGTGADLGTASDPGNNTFRGSALPGVTGVTVPTNVVNSTISAVGNTWNPNVQGADSSGRYPRPVVVTGQSPLVLAKGLNFNVAPFNSNPGVNIELGPGAAVGTFRLSPRTLSARAGRLASWKLAWRHPLGWKRLDQVAVRLEARGKPVGRIVLDQETRRLRASGPAVRLVTGRSTVAGGGKRLTARLTLRIAKRYTGRTLVARLAARDDNGTRQGWRKAGRLRVLAD
jgi:hypothetical protein